MGQTEIIEYLEKYPQQWFTTRQLSEALGVNIGNIAVCCKRLLRSNFVLFKMDYLRVGYTRNTKAVALYKYKNIVNNT